MRVKAILLFINCALFSCSIPHGTDQPPSFANDAESDSSILVGLDQVGVMIGLDLTIQETGVTADALRPEIEARLGKANFSVIPKAEIVKRNMENPTLIVRIADTTVSSGLFSYKMQLILRRHRLILSSQMPKDEVGTWSITRAGTVRKGESGKLQNAVAAELDQFLLAYHSLNPPR